MCQDLKRTLADPPGTTELSSEREGGIRVGEDPGEWGHVPRAANVP